MLFLLLSPARSNHLKKITPEYTLNMALFFKVNLVISFRTFQREVQTICGQFLCIRGLPLRPEVFFCFVLFCFCFLFFLFFLLLIIQTKICIDIHFCESEDCTM